MTCNDCIHKSVCYRTDGLSPFYADKCCDFTSEKTGYWIETDSDDPYQYMCSKCNRRIDDKEDYCPSCGAKMIESKEKEDKNETY